ncbi:MAG: hypothetical protein VW891_18210, partial [Novosphingobium sp.]
MKNTNDILNKIYSYNEIMKPKNSYMNIIILENKIYDENSVNIAQIFTDMKLGEYNDYTMLFSKMMMESYEDSHYKVLNSIIKDKNFPENPLSESDFIRLTKGTIV